MRSMSYVLLAMPLLGPITSQAPNITTDHRPPLSAQALLVRSLELVFAASGETPLQIRAVRSRFVPAAGALPDAVRVDLSLTVLATDADAADRIVDRIDAIEPAGLAERAPAQATYARIRRTFIEHDWIDGPAGVGNLVAREFELSLRWSADLVLPQNLLSEPQVDTSPSSSIARHAANSKVCLGNVSMSLQNRTYGGVEYRVCTIMPHETHRQVQRTQLANFFYYLETDRPHGTIVGIELGRLADGWSYKIELALPSEGE